MSLNSLISQEFVGLLALIVGVIGGVGIILWSHYFIDDTPSTVGNVAYYLGKLSLSVLAWASFSVGLFIFEVSFYRLTRSTLGLAIVVGGMGTSMITIIVVILSTLKRREVK